MPLILLIVLLLLAFGGLPTYGFHNYGYVPSSGLGLVFIIVLVLLLLGRI